MKHFLFYHRAVCFVIDIQPWLPSLPCPTSHPQSELARFSKEAHNLCLPTWHTLVFPAVLLNKKQRFDIIISLQPEHTYLDCHQRHFLDMFPIQLEHSLDQHLCCHSCRLGHPEHFYSHLCQSSRSSFFQDQGQKSFLPWDREPSLVQLLMYGNVICQLPTL